MADRAVTAAAEIATLRQKLAAAEARIREIEADKTRSAPMLDGMHQRIAALNCEIAKWWEREFRPQP
jgi:septal ring factor EnvC (AmiA/AmiB activator)